MSNPTPAKAASPTTPVPVKPLPFHWQLFAGAVAGVTELVTMYPLDVVKTRFQLQVGKGGPDGYTSIADCFRKIIKQEGFGRLYRGILPPILVEAPKRATKFAANEQYTAMYKKMFNVQGKMPQHLVTLTGVSAGCTEAFLVVSFELVKIRLQDKNNAGKYKHATWNGGYFSVINIVNDNLPHTDTYWGSMGNKFISGTIGGAFGTMLNTPFDVVKTRIQNQAVGTVRKYNWTLPALATIAKEEGATALYKGFVPKVLRLGPGGGILYVVYDQVTTFIRANMM
ncbi:mitochondrial carrier domain-containing protein [Catenaria anguillulae PL171]|uniref:Mitochondrial carrier domain-containing protein n=1 Tax=Catenaria anguillulae PL171 TaxID=765915 RepID=A0A1Y2I1N2_9FUNG|nr:mitochondrial carrier domain-containing protein [Catenaria anguillulae PL171]